MTGLRVPRRTLLSDAVTGLVMAVINVPQALATALAQMPGLELATRPASPAPSPFFTCPTYRRRPP